MEEPVIGILSLVSNRNLYFTKGMGEIKQYCVCSLAPDSKPPKCTLNNEALVLLSLKQRMNGAEGRCRSTFCTLEGSRTEKIKLIHLKLRLTVLGIYKNTHHLPLPQLQLVAFTQRLLGTHVSISVQTP